MELCMDEKWKLSKKASRNSSSSKRSSSSMMTASRKGRRMASRRSFARRCASLVKEQRAKFYIVRRCVTMLICWRDYP